MIYLDHAATSFPKPPQVLAAVQQWFEELGVSAERGDSGACARVAQGVHKTRHHLARMCGVADQRVVFTSGATESLNVFVDGSLGVSLAAGDAVLTTALEHSSLVRPLVHLRERRDVTIEVLTPDPDGRVPVERFAAALARRPFRLVAFSHASNVLGSVLDAEAICAVAREHGATSLVDASQTAGLLDLEIGADALVASAHKSLLAPPGLGFLAVRDGVELCATRFGGTGSSVALETQPTEWPTAMESGTPNTPAILGLGTALDYLDEHGHDAILTRELELIDTLRDELGDRVTFYGPTDGERIPVVSFTVPGYDSAEVGLLLDAAGIHVRTGFHCAPWLHERIGTADAGTIRISVGPFNSADDIRAVSTALSAG